MDWLREKITAPLWALLMLLVIIIILAIISALMALSLFEKSSINEARITRIEDELAYINELYDDSYTADSLYYIVVAGLCEDMESLSYGVRANRWLANQTLDILMEYASGQIEEDGLEGKRE